MHHLEKPSVSLIGAGAAGTSVAVSIQRAGLNVVRVFDIDFSRATAAAVACGAHPATTLAEAVQGADTIFVAVPDAIIADAAAEAASALSNKSDQIWLHLSGALPAAALSPIASKARSIGAFHPAQAFPEGRVTPIRPGTIFGTDGDDAALRRTETLAAVLGGRTLPVPPTLRARYHAACVSASNALLGVVAEAARTLADSGLDEEASAQLLIGLATGAFEQAAELGLSAALTGPVQRGDAATVKAHLDALRTFPEAERLYRETARATVRLAAQSEPAPTEALRRLQSLLDGD